MRLSESVTHDNSSVMARGRAQLGILAAVAAASLALLVPAASSAAPPGVPAPAWFEESIASGTLAPGSNCDWAYRPAADNEESYFWVLPPNLPPDPRILFPFVTSGGNPAYMCRRTLTPKRELLCAGFSRVGFEFGAYCRVEGDVYCYRSSTADFQGWDPKDCRFAPEKKCKKSGKKAEFSKKGKCGAKQKPPCGPKFCTTGGSMTILANPPPPRGPTGTIPITVSGELSSPRFGNRCERNRKIRLGMSVQYSEEGFTGASATAKTDASGHYSVVIPWSNSHGAFSGTYGLSSDAWPENRKYKGKTLKCGEVFSGDTTPVQVYFPS